MSKLGGISGSDEQSLEDLLSILGVSDVLELGSSVLSTNVDQDLLSTAVQLAFFLSIRTDLLRTRLSDTPTAAEAEIYRKLDSSSSQQP